MENLTGGSGNDQLTGGGGTNILDGGTGADTLVGDSGGDVLIGGAGSDTASYADHTGAVTADLDGVADDGSTGEGDRILRDIENIAGGAGSDTLTGDDDPNVLQGGTGPDDINGGGGGDVLEGQDGADSLHGEIGDDTVSGGSGDDATMGDEGDDALDGGPGSDSCDWVTGEPMSMSCRYDFRGPTFESLAVSKSTVSPGESLTITAHVTDPAGVTHAGFSIWVLGDINNFCGQRLQLTEGDAFDGYWTTNCQVPANMGNGVYTVKGYGWDSLSNETNINGGTVSTTNTTFEIVG